jgi:anti-sigma factor (TIGR02949 family)
MNCQDALDLLYDIIDREASDVDAQQVQEHLENCRDCFEVYRLERSVQEFIDEKIKTPAPNPKAEVLRAKIVSRLDEIDREGPTTRETPFFRLTTRTLVAAASLVVLIGAGFLIAAFLRHSDMYTPLEQAHWSAAENIETYQNNETTNTVIEHLSESHQCNIAPAVMNFTLLGGRTTEIMDADTDHLVYQNGDQVVSVFIVPADQFEISTDLEKTRVERNNMVFYDHNCRGCRLVYHRVGSSFVISASTHREVDLLNFVPGVLAI